MSTEDIVGIIQKHGITLSTVILPAVHPETGHLYDMKRIVATARKFKCTVRHDNANNLYKAVDNSSPVEPAVPTLDTAL